MKQPRLQSSSDGRGKAIELAPRLSEVTTEYQRLNTREARVALKLLAALQCNDGRHILEPVFHIEDPNDTSFD
jgi:hypothetical protein